MKNILFCVRAAFCLLIFSGIMPPVLAQSMPKVESVGEILKMQSGIQKLNSLMQDAESSMAVVQPMQEHFTAQAGCEQQEKVNFCLMAFARLIPFQNDYVEKFRKVQEQWIEVNKLLTPQTDLSTRRTIAAMRERQSVLSNFQILELDAINLRSSKPAVSFNYTPVAGLQR